MSIAENIEKYQEEISRETRLVQEAMMKSVTGSKVMEVSSEMAESQEMNNLMLAISSPDASERDQAAMGQYMGQMLQASPRNGLENFARYLDKLIADTKYASRHKYFSLIRDTARALNTSEIFRKYTDLYEKFQDDLSPEAKAARLAMENMSKKAKKWAGNQEESSNPVSNNSGNSEVR